MAAAGLKVATMLSRWAWASALSGGTSLISGTRESICLRR